MTWDTLAALLVVAAALWLLRWSATHGSCSSCPTHAEAGAAKARLSAGESVRKRPDQLRLSSCGCANSANAAAKDCSASAPRS